MGGEQLKMGVTTVGQVLRYTCFLGLMLPVPGQGQLDLTPGPGYEDGHLHQPLTSTPFPVYRASSEMTFYQKKHDIKLFRPLILPLTQVSKKHFPSNFRNRLRETTTTKIKNQITSSVFPMP